MKLYYANTKERDALVWVKANYGRGWRKRFGEPVSVAERSFPYPSLKGHVNRPFGRADWNVMVQWARNCIRRNECFPAYAKRTAIGRV